MNNEIQKPAHGCQQLVAHRDDTETALLPVANALVDVRAWPDVQRFVSTFESVFRRTRLEECTVLDIGCGVGSMTFGAAAMGAKLAVGLEPEMDGSAGGYIATGRRLAATLGFTNAIITNCALDNYDFAEGPFDVVVMCDVINHLDEQACVHLRDRAEARESYKAVLASLLTEIKKDGVLIITDCSRSNLWGDLRITNPVAKTIEWAKHQDPSTWSQLLKSIGFRSVEYWWNPLHRLRFLGPFAETRPVSYVTNSHFIMRATK